MYNPDDIREVEKRRYEGVSRTFIQNFKVENNSCRVDRPRGLVQRAHIDVKGIATVMTTKAVERTVDARFDSSASLDYYADNIPENTSLTIAHPFTQATSSIIFRPEDSNQNEHYKSRPNTLHKVLRYTADPDQYEHTSKCTVLSTRHVRYNRATYTDDVVDEAEEQDFLWRWRDNPGSSLILMQHAEDLYNARRWLRCAEVRNEAHNEIGQIRVFRDLDT